MVALLAHIYFIKEAKKIPISPQLGSSCRATGPVRKRQVVRPVHHVQNHTCRVTPLHPARRAAVLDQPSSLRPHCSHPQNIVHIQTAAYSCDVSGAHFTNCFKPPPPHPRCTSNYLNGRVFLFPFFYIWIIKVGTIMVHPSYI